MLFACHQNQREKVIIPRIHEQYDGKGDKTCPAHRKDDTEERLSKRSTIQGGGIHIGIWYAHDLLAKHEHGKCLEDARDNQSNELVGKP